MPQTFHPRANAFTKLILLGGAALLIVGATALVQLNWSNWSSGEEVFVEQPVEFSHEHHVSGLGIDCRYCHSSVQKSQSAGMPATHTCMSCHSQMWTQSEMLKPVRESYRSGEPIQWNRVYDLPDYVYFSHEAHTNSGVACESCHGRIDQMPLTYQANDLYMQWCLDCHREPEKNIRPAEFVYAFGYEERLDEQGVTDKERLAMGRRLVEQYGIQKGRLTNCSVCHR
ncbi:MAG: cytochrome C [Bacteroidetes bacterium QH_2_67_10]|nr:MAG: cytochrome C [Bacteroidetes bacterium QH_2_67_10]